MKSITFSKPDLPFLFGGNGSLAVNANVDSITQPLTPSDQDVLSLEFGAQGNTSFSFGTPDNIKLGIQAGAKNRLYGLWPKSSPDRLAVLGDHGLADFFASHPDQMILVLSLGADAAAQLTGSFTYAALTASTTLNAGGNAGYTYLHPYPADTPSDKLFLDFLGGLRLPAVLSEGIPLGEVIAFEYGGYLKLGASLAVGYKLMGAPDFSIGQLQLSEHYQFSVAGSLDLGAQIAGQFSVEARAAVDEHGLAKPGWVQVIVHKNRSSSFHIAADAGVIASTDLEGLPDSADEFLGALLGIRAKNWLNMISRVRELSDLDALKKELDDLGKKFIETWIGKAFDELSKTEFADLLEHVQKVVDSYQNLDNSAITLFDRYFDKLGFLTAQLNKLSALTSWDNLKGQVDGDLWQVVQQLTDGDPLTWILGEIEKKDKNGKLTPVPSLPELKARVQQALDLIQTSAHDEIRKVIGIAKQHFPLDHFVQELSTVDSIPSLKALADDKAIGFFERLLGTAVDEIKNSEASQIFTRLHKALNSIKDFEDNAYAKFKDAVHQSFTFNLHAEYNRSTESDALVDVEINVSTPLGQSLLRAAGSGDFQDVLASFRPDVVRLNQGALTHNVTKSSSLSVNIFGWHDGWHYKGMDTIIAQTDQHIVTGKDNTLCVYSTVTLKEDRVREVQDQTTTTNLLVRFMGESNGALVPDKKNQQFLIDAITSGAVTYSLGFTDKKTPRKRLEYFLSFAESFGLAAQGATVENLLPLLPMPDPKKDDFGPMEVSYEVRYAEEGLKALAGVPLIESDLRLGLRRIVLASYLRDSGLTDIGWCYWTDGIYRLWKKGQAAFTSHLSPIQLSPIADSPFSQFPQPPNVSLTPTQLRVLSTLFFIEDDFVKSLLSLSSMIKDKRGISPSQFEHNLSDLGSALKNVSDFDKSVNGLFSLFDQLVRKQTPAPQARLSSLTIKSKVDGNDVTKVFLAGGAPIAAPAPAVAATPVAPKGKAAVAP
jgi:hypothetical protein